MSQAILSSTNKDLHTAYKGLLKLTKRTILKQIDDEDLLDINFNLNLVEKYGLDSVDLVSIILEMEKGISIRDAKGSIDVHFTTERMQDVSKALDLVLLAGNAIRNSIDKESPFVVLEFKK